MRCEPGENRESQQKSKSLSAVKSIWRKINPMLFYHTCELREDLMDEMWRGNEAHTAEITK